MRLRLKLYLLIILSSISCLADAVAIVPRFYCIGYAQGLSDNKVNCIYKNSRGFVWIGTSMGLNRYDGFRIKTYFCKPSSPASLPDNNIDQIVEDAEGMLWVKTLKGFCIYNPDDESFDRNVADWMRSHGMNCNVSKLTADEQRHLWIEGTDNNLYLVDFKSDKARKVLDHRQQPMADLTFITAKGGSVVLNYQDGTLLRLSARTLKITDRLKVRPSATRPGVGDYSTFIDSQGNLWIYSSDLFSKYDIHTRQWHHMNGYLVKAVAEDRQGRLLLATDHEGLLIADKQGHLLSQSLYSPASPLSLPDNTLQTLYMDNMGIVWIGTYRMGLACYDSGRHLFDLLPLGDVCSMCEAPDGTLWFGTNDKGIGNYDLRTRKISYISQAQSHLGSDVVVATLCDRDGGLWFGSFQGGLTHYSHGKFTAYRVGHGGLANDNVWALCQVPDGRIAIGTLGGGLQLLNPTTGKFRTFNTRNSKLPSDYIASLATDGRGHLIIGHSQSVSLLDLRSYHITNLSTDKLSDEGQQVSPSVTQVISDSHGLIWMATTSGLCVYNPTDKRYHNVPLQGNHPFIDVSAIAEDQDGRIWATTSDGLKCVVMSLNQGQPEFYVSAYGSMDGIQTRLFNKRSIICLRDGRVLVGGIDGVNVIDRVSDNPNIRRSEIVFSDLLLFNHVVDVGEKINGRIVLKQSINESRSITLDYDEDDFTLLLSTTMVGLPYRQQFLYRLKGQSDDWRMTDAATGGVRFTHLSPGHYTLEVQRVDAVGQPLPGVAKFSIVVRPPFYLSGWAWLCYIVLFLLTLYYIYRAYKHKRLETLQRLELKKQKEIEEMKMVFFTNISHELRTPLTLIMSPLPGIIARESNSEITAKLKLIQRNAYRMLGLVNDILDLRRIMKGKETLHKQRADIVAFVKGIGNQFVGLTDKDVTLTFLTDAQSVSLDFDEDKMGKVFNNLLSNAFKYVPSPGRVEVAVRLPGDGMVHISVADNGPGISDADKKHLFDRFFQGSDKHQSGSGIGLNLVAVYTQMHGGTVSVDDNPKGGTIFTVTLPIQQSEIAGEGFAEAATSTPNDATEQGNEDQATKSENRRYTLLLVDDNDDFLIFLKGELSDDYRVVTASNGQEALSAILEERPDAILSDVMMPVMDGNELCRRVKADPTTKDIPFIMLTARLSEENEKESRECGADDYVKKPFNVNQLKMQLSQLIQRGQLSTTDGKVEPHITQVEITPVDKKFVDDATSYIEKHLDDTSLTVETMSRDLGMSRVNLYRHLVSATGKTPTEFIRLIRLRHAEKLVMKSQLTVSEIAYSVGFASPRYFSRCYKELFGYLPSQYKKPEA